MVICLRSTVRSIPVLSYCHARPHNAVLLLHIAPFQFISHLYILLQYTQLYISFQLNSYRSSMTMTHARLRTHKNMHTHTLSLSLSLSLYPHLHTHTRCVALARIPLPHHFDTQLLMEAWACILILFFFFYLPPHNKLSLRNCMTVTTTRIHAFVFYFW